MKRVARSEGALLTVARALFEPQRAPTVRRAVQTAIALPPRIGPTAMGLLQSTLARGVLCDLLAAGGWRRQRPRADAVGRLWERHPRLHLDFSPATAELLFSLVQSTPGSLPDLAPTRLTPADRWVRVLALDLLTRLGLAASVEPFVGAPLCWLMRVDTLAAASAVPDGLDFAPLVEGPMAAWLEAAQPRLAARWLGFERRKPLMRALDQMAALGEAQRVVLAGFFSACDRADRRDLAGFAVHAAQNVLAPRPGLRWWIQGLDNQAALSERQRAWRGAAGFLASLEMPARWHAAHGRTRFFDDDYDTAQHLLGEWEGFGRAGFEQAAALARDLSGFHGQTEDQHR